MGELPAAVPSWLREVPLAHRGLHDHELAENTLPAFAAAHEAGVGVELDVQLSVDGVPIVFHDLDLRRLAGVEGPVDARTAAELADLRILGGDHGIPTLAAVLDVLGPTPTMVEVKNPHARIGDLEPAVAELLDARMRAGAAICVASFNPWSLRWIRRHAPGLPRVLTAGSGDGVDLSSSLRWSARHLPHLAVTAPVALSYDVRALDTPAVRRYRRRGGTVIAWTVTNRDELQQARRGADNVIFESLPVAEVSAAG